MRTLPVALTLFVITAAAVPAVLRGQTGGVEGQVTESGGKPLAGATVRIEGTVLGAVTDAEGRYRLRKVKPGIHVVQFSMMGYERKEVVVHVRADSVATADAALTQKPIETSEVVVTAGRRAQSYEEVPVSVSVSTAREIRDRAITSIDQALRNIPGVNLTESQVNIRGSSGYARALGSRVLLLLDGVPLLAGDANEIKYDAVPMFLVDRIEVVKGAASALYGSSALGGVINVITLVPTGPLADVRTYAGCYGEPRYDQWVWWGGGPRWFGGMDAAVGNAAGAFSWTLAAGARGNAGYRQNDDFFKWNASASGHYRPDGDRNLSVSLHIASDDRGNWLYWRNLEHALEQPLDADLSEHIHSTKTQGTARYRRVVSPVFAYTARASVYRTAFDTRSDTADYTTHPADKTQSTAVVYGAEWQGTFAPSERHMLVGGIDAAYTTVASTTFGDRSGVSCALYGQEDFRVHERLSLTLGVRFDWTKVDTTRSDNRLNPRLGIAWKAAEGTVVRASYGTGFRAPSVAERFAAASGAGLTTKPNPNLLSERSTSYEIGVKQDLPWAVSLDVAVFRNEYSNLVEPLLDPADGRITFANITRARIQGVEIGLRAAPFGGRCALAAGYTYMDPRDLTRGTIMKYRSRHLFTASGELRILDGSLGADFRYVGRMEEIDRELGLIVTNAEQRVPVYVTDVRVGWDFSHLGIPASATFIVNNVFQYAYTEIVGNLSPIRHFLLVLEAKPFGR